MKNYLVIIVTLSLSFSLTAQETIKVEYDALPFYESANNKYPDLEMRAIPSSFELLIKGDESVFEYVDRIDNSQPSEGMSMSFKITANGSIYKNTRANIYMDESTKIGNTLYLIKDSLPTIDWSIEDETKEIVGYKSQKATAELDDKRKTKVTAWFTRELEYNTGPEKYWGLPGLILELRTEIAHESGSREGIEFTAVSIKKSKSKIKVPSKGEEINQKDFDLLYEEYWQKQMQVFEEGVDKD